MPPREDEKSDDDATPEVNPLWNIEGNEMTDDQFYKDDCEITDEEYVAQQKAKGNNRAYQSRTWCFTWNNYPTDHKTRLLEGLPTIRYIIWGYEEAPTTKTRHLQGFVVFVSDQRYGTRNRSKVDKETKEVIRGEFRKNTLKGAFPSVYWKVMYSNAAACIDYCSKGGKAFERGTKPEGAGARTDLKAVCDAVITGGYTTEELAMAFPQQFVKYSSGLSKLAFIVSKARTGRPKCIWLFGEAGKGKTQVPFLGHDSEHVFQKRDGTLYWGDYDQKKHAAILINEFMPYAASRPRGWDLQDFLQVLDQYADSVQVKYGYAKLGSPTIYITSSVHPKNMGYSDGELKQIYRRLDMLFVVKDEDTIIEYVPPKGMSYYSEELVKPITFTHPLLDKMKALGQMHCAQQALARKAAEQARGIPIRPVLPSDPARSVPIAAKYAQKCDDD